MAHVVTQLEKVVIISNKFLIPLKDTGKEI